METEEVSDRFVAPCFVNELEAYDVKRGNKVVKNELIVALRGEIYFVKFIINPEEDDVEPEKPKKKKSNDDWDHLLDFNIDDIPLLGKEGLSPFVCKMWKSGRNKKRAMENLNFFFQDIGTSSSAGGHLTQEEAAKEELAIKMRREDMKKVDRGITMINHTQAEAMGILTNVLCQVGVTTLIAKFLILDIPIDRDSPIVVGQGFLRTIGGIVNALWEHTMMRPDHHDPNALDNVKPYKKYCFHKFTMSSCYGKDITELQSLDVLNRMDCDGEIDDMLRIRLGLYQAVKLEEEGFNVYFDGGLHSDEHFNAQDYWTTRYDKIQKNDLWLLSMFDARYENGYANVAWVIARWMKRKGDGTQKESQICCGQFILKISRKCRVLTEDVVRSLSAPVYCRDLDTITLRDLIDSDGKLIIEDPEPGVPRVGISKPPRASMQDLYDRMGRMEIRQEAIERMEYRQSYHRNSGTHLRHHSIHRSISSSSRMMMSSVETTRVGYVTDVNDRMGRMEIRQEAIEQMEYRQSYRWDKYQGVFEHMVGVYSVPLQRAYNPPGYGQP
ncbi:hypothetical protein Tco_0882245 [Tanacetum coccineum]